MEFKKIMTTTMAFGAMTFASQHAMASSGFEVTLGATLGSTYSCNACHVGGVGAASTATLPMALTLKAGLNLATTDSDGDGFTNAQEVSGTALNFNDPAITPFTVATGGTALTNVYVKNDALAVEKAFTAASAGITLPATNQILGNISVDIYTTPSAVAPVTLLFKAGAAAATSKVYVVDTYTQSNTPLAATTEWTTAADGSVVINLLPAGVTTPATIVVERVIPTAAIAGLYGGYFDDDDDEDGEGCIMASASTPLMMLLSLLFIGLFIRKRD